MSTKKGKGHISIIYALIDPRNSSVFYIGITRRSMLDRLNGHLRDRTQDKKCNIISELSTIGLKPLIEDLEICYGHLDSMRAEKWWQYHYTFVLKHPVVGSVTSVYYRIRKDADNYLKRKNANRAYW